ncbi:MAG: choice-of-anchor S family protein [Promethearchaeota archaeon]
MKARIVYIAVFLSFLVLGMTFTSPVMKGSADLGADIGDEFTFVVNKFSIALAHGASQSSTNKFSVAGSNTISPGGSDANFKVEVVDYNETGIFAPWIQYEISKGSFKENQTVNAWTMVFLPFAIYYPQIFVSVITSGDPFNTTVENDISDFVPYILAVNGTTDQAWEVYQETFKNKTSTETEDDSNLTTEVQNSMSGGNFAVYTKWQGEIKNATSDDQMTFDCQMRVVYEMSTGALQGYKLFMDVDGTVNNKTSAADFDVEIVRQGYTIQGFGGGGFWDNIPGFETVALVFGLVALGGLYIYRKRRK